MSNGDFEPDRNVWERILDRLRMKVDEEEFRRWFAGTAYASDSGDQITVWVPTEAVRRHVALRYEDLLQEVLETLDRRDTFIRFVVSGYGDEDEDVDE